MQASTFIYRYFVLSALILLMLVSSSLVVVAQAERSRGPIYLDTVTTTSIALRWNKQVDVTTYTVCLGRNASTIATSDTTIVLNNLQPATSYRILVGVGSTCGTRMIECYNHIVVSTLTPALQSITYDGRLVSFGGTAQGQRLLIDSNSTVFYQGPNPIESMPQLESLLLSLWQQQVPMDSVVVVEGYNGIGSACLGLVSPAAYGASINIKMARLLTESERIFLQGLQIRPVWWMWDYTFTNRAPTAAQKNGTPYYSACYQTRLYGFPRAVSVQNTPQATSSLMVVPQPLTGNGECRVTVPNTLTADIRLVNMLGQTVVVLAQGQRLLSGVHTFPIASAGLANGVYAVQVVSGGRILHTQSIVVAR